MKRVNVAAGSAAAAAAAAAVLDAVAAGDHCSRQYTNTRLYNSRARHIRLRVVGLVQSDVSPAAVRISVALNTHVRAGKLPRREITFTLYSDVLRADVTTLACPVLRQMFYRLFR